MSVDDIIDVNHVEFDCCNILPINFIAICLGFEFLYIYLYCSTKHNKLQFNTNSDGLHSIVQYK